MFERQLRCSGFYACIMIVSMVCIGFSYAIAEEARTLQILRDKGIISQEEFDQAMKEEKAEAEKYREKEKQPEKKPEGLTKNGLQVKLGGFAEIDFIGDNTRSFEEIVGNRPVLRSGTLGGDNSQFATSPRNSRIIIDVRAPERHGIKTQYYGSVDFIGNEPEIGDAGVSELTVRTSPTARIFQMYFKVETPAADFKVGQDWSAFGFMSQYSRGQVSVAATPANMFNRWIQASVTKRFNLTDSFFMSPIFSVERPPQRDGNLPSFVAGIQFAYHGLQAAYTGASTGTTLSSLSVFRSAAWGESYPQMPAEPVAM